jgi:hypothetical protein
MNVKPMFEDGPLPVPKKFVPTAPAMVKESSLLHRKGKAIRNADGMEVGRKGEHVKKQRHAIAGSRDKLALAGSSAKRRFPVTNGHIDRRLDAPPAPVMFLAPKPVRGRRMPRPCQRP